MRDTTKMTSKAKMRLRSGGFKCSLCGRRVVDAALLERHLKTIHNIPGKGRKIVFKAKPKEDLNETDIEEEKAFEDLVRNEILAEERPKLKHKKSVGEIRVTGEGMPERTAKVLQKKVESPQTTDQNQNESVENVEDENNQSQSGKKLKSDKRKAEFQCPVCSKMFNVYHTAHRHIQRCHPVNMAGEKVPLNSPDLIQPIRVEECVRCSSKMKSTEPHSCQYNPDDNLGLMSQYVCSSCNQSFISLKTFDIHVAGLHSNGVESLFFPTELEFTNWRLEMERQTQAKYSTVGDYDSKKVYRCNYARGNVRSIEGTTYFCPSTMIVQNFTKGIQVHFYQEHCDHPTRPYMLASKYINYSITTFLKNPGDLNNASVNKILDHKELHTHFKALMDSIIADARKVDVPKLKLLIEKAIDMTKVLSLVDESVSVKSNKSMTDKEITEELEFKSASQKRRKSADHTVKSVPSKRTRNQMLFCESSDGSPKIVNTYSLATNIDGIKSDSEVHKETESKSNKSLSGSQSEGDTKSNKLFNKTAFNQSPSFNDSYKDFVDKTIKATMSVANVKAKRTSDRIARSTTVVNVPTTPQKTELETEVDVAKIPVTKSVKDVNVTPKVKTVDTEENTDTNDVTTPKMGPKKLSDITITKIASGTPNLVNKSTKVYTPKFTKNFTKPNILKTDIKPSETPLSAVKVKKDFKYEVREQENDCNILVLKF